MSLPPPRPTLPLGEQRAQSHVLQLSTSTMFQAEVEDYNGRKRKIVRRAACELSNIQTHLKPYDASVIAKQEEGELCCMLHDS